MRRTKNYPSKIANQGNIQVSKYYGLINQGATCYLNSVLQVLFMTEGFREAVRSSKSSWKNTFTNGIDRKLCNLFNALTKETAETREVIKKLRIKNVHEQHDAAEYFERILTKTNDEAKQIFKGELTYRTVCQCKSETDKIVSFWNLPLPLTDSHDKTYTVVDGIQEFFKNSEFTGENQLYCESCGNKCDATIQCKVKHHPEVVMLLLKRFEFNYHHMKYMKKCLPVDVSLTITLPEKQRYELYALVEHMGTLKSGHYMATIKPQNEDTWYEFNDSTVTRLENEEVKKDKLQKSDCVYLLFYRKSNTGTQSEGEMSVLLTPQSHEHNITGSRHNRVRRKEINEPNKRPSCFQAFSSPDASDLPNEDRRIACRNTNDSSTRPQKQCESKDKSGSFKRWDNKEKSFHSTRGREKEPMRNDLKRSLSWENTSKNDRSEHRKHVQMQHLLKANSFEQNISVKPQQQRNERVACKVQNEVRDQVNPQLLTIEPYKAKSSLTENWSQKRPSGDKLDCNTHTIFDDSYVKQKDRNTNGDDDKKDDHHSTTGQQEEGSMRQGEQSHGEITHNKKISLRKSLTFWKKNRNVKCERAESKTHKFPTEKRNALSQDCTIKDQKGIKEKIEKNREDNGEKLNKNGSILTENKQNKLDKHTAQHQVQEEVQQTTL